MRFEKVESFPITDVKLSVSKYDGFRGVRIVDKSGANYYLDSFMIQQLLLQIEIKKVQCYGNQVPRVVEFRFPNKILKLKTLEVLCSERKTDGKL